jgi:hypothetical protein
MAFIPSAHPILNITKAKPSLRFLRHGFCHHLLRTPVGRCRLGEMNGLKDYIKRATLNVNLHI